MGQSGRMYEISVRGKKVGLVFFTTGDDLEWSVDVILERDGEQYPESCTAVTGIPVNESPLHVAKLALPILDRLLDRMDVSEDWPNLEPVLKALASLGERPYDPFLERLRRAVDEAISCDT